MQITSNLIISCAFWAIFALGLSTIANAQIYTAPEYQSQQLWECTKVENLSSPNERFQFLVTGQATRREISTRLNFQNDEVVVSVAIVNLDPETCPKARSFLHMGFAKVHLDQCEPFLITDDRSRVSRIYWKKLRDARGEWLIKMQLGKSVTLGISPSKIFQMLSRTRCNDEGQ